MKTIIAPTDFSLTATNATSYAADLAVAIQADLLLLHVAAMPMNFSEIPVPTEGILAEIIKDAEINIRRLQKELLQRTGGKINIYTEIRMGAVMRELEDICEIQKPTAVVMGTQGAGSIERFLFGSNTISAITHLDWPLIAVPPEASFKGIRKIGLACDFRKVIETVPVQEIRDLVNELQAELHILHSCRQDKPWVNPQQVEESGWIQEMFNDLHPHYHYLNSADIDDGISEFVQSNMLDLLIVIPKKHSLYHKLLNRSHSRTLVLHAHVPVMAVHE